MLAKNIFKNVMPVIFILATIIGCEYEGPTEVWDPDQPGKIPAPVITSVIPENVAAAGINEIKLVGQNFSPTPAENLIYVSGVKVPVKTASNNELAIYRPNFYGENLTIKLVVKGALEVAEYSPYAIERIGDDYGSFSSQDLIKAFDFDAEGNLFAYVAGKIIYKVPPEGVKTLYISNSLRTTDDLKVGPGGVLYLSRNTNGLYKVSLENPGGVKTPSLPGTVNKFDFDEKGNIFCGGSSGGLIVLNPDESSRSVFPFPNYEILAVRIFNGFVYYVAEYDGKAEGVIPMGIWRNKITSDDGEVAEQELVLDWTTSGIFAETQPLDFTFAADGVMLIATDGGEENLLDPILMLSPDGKMDPFYPNGILTAPVEKIVWGNGENLYLFCSGSMANRKVLQLKMSRPGAPYYGRLL